MSRSHGVQRPSLVYRAQARCDRCQWKGNRYVTGVHSRNADAAYADANAHYQDTGHHVTVHRWWRATCHRCHLQSPPFQRKRETMYWWDDHKRTDRWHLRLAAAVAEQEALANRVAQGLLP